MRHQKVTGHDRYITATHVINFVSLQQISLSKSVVLPGLLDNNNSRIISGRLCQEVLGKGMRIHFHPTSTKIVFIQNF